MAANGKFTVQVVTIMCTYLLVFLISVDAKDKSKADNVNEADRWKKKDIRDYSDADLERLFEQWEDADEEQLEPDELPEWKRPQPKVDLSKLDPNNPEAMLRATKKGKTLMMFAGVSGDPTEKETEQITKLWQSSLFNANMETQRYVVASNRVLFMLKDGSYAWDIKDYLVNQDRCEVVTIEGQDFPGRGSPNFKEPGEKRQVVDEKIPKSTKNKTTKTKKPTEKKKKTDKKKKTVSDQDNRTARKKDTEKVEL